MAAKARSSSQDSDPKPRSDAYVGLLLISLFAQLVGAALLYLDYSQYEGSKDPVAIARDLKTKAGNPPAPATPAPVPPPPPPKGP